MSKEKIIKKLELELPALKNRYPIKELGIFGSVARGDDTPTSDVVDILVELDYSKPIGLFKFIHLENELSSLLQKKVDLVTKDGLKPVIKSNVLKDVIYC